MDIIGEIDRAINGLQEQPEPLRRAGQRLFDMGPSVSLFVSPIVVRQLMAETSPYCLPHKKPPQPLPTRAVAQVLGLYLYENRHLPDDVLVFGYPLANGGCDLVKIVKLERPMNQCSDCGAAPIHCLCPGQGQPD